MISGTAVIAIPPRAARPSFPPTVANRSSLADRKDLAAGVLQTAHELGGALGPGVNAAVVAARTAAIGGERARAAALLGTFRWGLLPGLGFVVLALLVALVGLRGASRTAAEDMTS